MTYGISVGVSGFEMGSGMPIKVGVVIVECCDVALERATYVVRWVN